MEFGNLLGILLVAAAIPLLLGLLPRLPVPSVVVEIVAGIVIGPSVLGWVEIDGTVEVLAVIGLAFLLFLSGLEIDPSRLAGAFGRLALGGMVATLLIAGIVATLLSLVGAVESPVFVAIVLSATSLGVVVALLKDAGVAASPLGQLTITGSSVADVATVVLLSLLFSMESSGTGSRVLLLSLFALFLVVLGFAIVGVEHSRRIGAVIQRLADTTAQIRVRLAVLLLVGLAAAAEAFGFEAILGAFLAGAVLRLVDRDAMSRHPQFAHKLEGIGFGFLIPVFFVSSGVTFDLGALTESPSALAWLPVLLVSLLAVRGLPALLYRRQLGSRREVAVAALLQATSLPFIVAATQIGLALGEISPATAASLVAAGLLSVLVYPAVALRLLRSMPQAGGPAHVPSQAHASEDARPATTGPGGDGAGSADR